VRDVKSKEEELCRMVTITIIYDNNPWDNRLRAAWGFSCLIEKSEEKVLFDTGGNSSTLISNMEKLDISPESIDLIVLSHPHGDHTGGLPAILRKNRGVKLYLGCSFPESFKVWAKEEGADVIEIYDEKEIDRDFYTTGELGHIEQSVVLKTERGLIVITGCAHPGIVSILEKVKREFEEKIHLVLGGFHLGSVDVSKEFRRLGVERVAPCHCTGDRAMALLKNAYRNDFIRNGVGRMIEVQKE
jgi:7,8-dihydropterin-6-yl-methyl-4-(beta-D-ribofuranosyl)aminobenzene 5'-phosphate synthase